MYSHGPGKKEKQALVPAAAEDHGASGGDRKKTRQPSE
jgi:hypothetical protein